MDIDRRYFLKAGVAAIAVVAERDSGAALAQEAAGAVVYFNGTILTMEGDQPATVEAVAVKDGKIAFAGPLDAARVAVGQAREVDLQGRTMLPGFIDSWGHFTLFAQQTLGVNLAYFADKRPASKADAASAVFGCSKRISLMSLPRSFLNLSFM